MAVGRKLADAYVELHAEDSKLKTETKVKAQRVGKEFGGQLNQALKKANIDPIDVKASPAQALAAIASTKERLEALRDSAETVEIRIQAIRALAQAERLRKQIGEPVTVEVKVDSDIVVSEVSRFRRMFSRAGSESAEGFAANFGDKFGPLMKVSMTPHVIAGLGIVAAALAPMIGGVIAAGVIGGAGGTGVIGGLVLAAKDVRVKAAADAMGTRIEARLGRAAGAFVQPALDGLHEIQRAADDINFESILRESSNFVPVLTKGVTSALSDLGDGFEDLVANAGPVMAAFSRTIAAVGDSVGDMLTTLSSDAPAAASSVDDLTAALTNMVQVTTFVIHGLAQIKSALDGADNDIDSFRFALEDALSIGDVAGAQFDITADGMSNMDRRAKQAAEGMGTLSHSVAGATVSIDQEADAAADAKVQNDALTAAQKLLTAAQDAFKRTLDSLAPALDRNASLSDGLRQAATRLYGAAIAGADANQTYEASWDSLSESVKANGRSLNVHTAAGRANRDSLKALLAASNEMYYANIASGVSTAGATEKHRLRTEQVRKEARQLHLNKDETNDLIGTYGKIPKAKTTELVLDGVRAIGKALTDLYVFQRALAEGRSITSMEQILRKGSDSGPAKRFGGFAAGGEVPGWSPNSRADNITAQLTAKEWVHPVDAVQFYGPRFMAAIQKRRLPREIGQLAGYAAGGMVGPVDTSRRWAFHANMSKTQVMSRSQAAAKVAGQFGGGGNWPSSPSAQRGDSGVWRRIVAMIGASGTNQGSFGNGYRPGDPLWHGSGRAVDWMGSNLDRLAGFFLQRQGQILEMIHRSSRRDYAYTRGKNQGSFNEGLMQAHRNHLHIAMAEGGQVPARVSKVAMADTGKMTLEQGWNLIGNGTGARESMSTSGGGEIHFHFHGPVASKQAAEDMVVAGYESARKKKRL